MKTNNNSVVADLRNRLIMVHKKHLEEVDRAPAGDRCLVDEPVRELVRPRRRFFATRTTNVELRGVAQDFKLVQCPIGARPVSRIERMYCNE